MIALSLTHERLRELLDYDPDTGEFRWRRSRPRAKAGAVAGSNIRDGYRKIGIDGRHYKSHRLAGLYMTMEWPNGSIDHRDCDPSNNAWNNLRLASYSQNGANARLPSNNRSGFKGVSFARREGRWRAAIRTDGKHRHLGYFETNQAAHEAYLLAARLHFGEFARAE